MASSFITIDDEHGFWVRDALMEVACWGLVTTIDTHADQFKWMIPDFRNHLFNNSQGYFVGWMHLQADDYLNTPVKKVSFLDCITEAKIFFSQQGTVIPVNDIPSFQQAGQTHRTWTRPLEVDRILLLLCYLERTVKGELMSKAGDDIFEF